MSYHAIENLVEDAVRLTDKSELTPSEKRNMFYNLYRFQHLFDTGYTMLRCFDILVKNNFLQKIPVGKHPDFNSHSTYFSGFDYEENNWLLSDVSDAGAEVVFVEKESGGTFLYPEFGSQIWKRLFPKDDDAITLSTMELMLKIMQAAKQQGEEVLMKNFYVALVKGFVEGDLSEGNGFPKDFASWMTDDTLLEIRKLFIENDLLKITKKQTEFEIPKLRDELAIADETFAPKVRFLMDAKKTLPQLQKEAEKIQAAEKDESDRNAIIKTVCDAGMLQVGWQFFSETASTDGKTFQLLYRKIVNSENPAKLQRLFIMLDFERGLKGLYVVYYLQHPLLRDWQKISDNADSFLFHFKNDLYNILSDEAQTALDKKFNYMGLWRWNFKASEKTMAKSLNELLPLIRKAETEFSENIEHYFPEHFFSRTAEDYVKIFDEMEEMPKDLLVHNLKHILLILIFEAAQKGNFSKAKSIIEILEHRTSAIFEENNLWYKNEVLPFLNTIKKEKMAALPNLNPQ